MEPRDKYTVYSKWDRGYRKGIHKMPKFTRVRSLPFLVHAVSKPQFLLGHSTREPEGFLVCLYSLAIAVHVSVYITNIRPNAPISVWLSVAKLLDHFLR